MIFSIIIRKRSLRINEHQRNYIQHNNEKIRNSAQSHSAILQITLQQKILNLLKWHFLLIATHDMPSVASFHCYTKHNNKNMTLSITDTLLNSITIRKHDTQH